MAALLKQLEGSAFIHEIRQCGFMAGIEVRDRGGDAFPWQERTGGKICEAARKHGLLTRPVLDTVVLMPPLCTSENQLETAVSAIGLAIEEVCGR
jgi:adenosylmethionine-8-amino-7-oxononanoate aminotransferase